MVRELGQAQRMQTDADLLLLPRFIYCCPFLASENAAVLKGIAAQVARLSGDAPSNGAVALCKWGYPNQQVFPLITGSKQWQSLFLVMFRTLASSYGPDRLFWQRGLLPQTLGDRRCCPQTSLAPHPRHHRDLLTSLLST